MLDPLVDSSLPLDLPSICILLGDYQPFADYLFEHSDVACASLDEPLHNAIDMLTIDRNIDSFALQPPYGELVASLRTTCRRLLGSDFLGRHAAEEVKVIDGSRSILLYGLTHEADLGPLEAIAALRNRMIISFFQPEIAARDPLLHFSSPEWLYCPIGPPPSDSEKLHDYVTACLSLIEEARNKKGG